MNNDSSNPSPPKSTFERINKENDSSHSYNTTRLAEIVPGLWIGPLHSVAELCHVPPRTWTVISVLHSDKLSDYIQRTLLEVNDPVRHIEWELPDKCQSAFVSQRLSSILQIMNEALSTTGSSSSVAPAAVLVHCAFGVSRSAAVCAAFLLYTRRSETVAEALQVIRKVRPEASPNLGFLAGLRALEQCGGNVGDAMERMRVRNIGAIP